MKVGTVGKILVGIGIILLLYAQRMPVSIDGSTFVNIHLISERQNTLMIGGLLFLAGIVLFAVFKMKQTKEDEIAANSQTKEVNELIKVHLKNISTTGDGYLTGFRKYFFKENESLGSLILRFFFGLIVGGITYEQVQKLVYGLIIMHSGDDYFDRAQHVATMSDSSSTAIAAFVLLYAFRSKQKLVVFRNILIGYIALSALTKIVAYIITEQFQVWVALDVYSMLSIVAVIYISTKLRVKS